MKYAVYIPAGPQVNPEFLADTIKSALLHIGQDTAVVIGEDGSQGRYEPLKSLGPNVVVRQVEKVDDQPHKYDIRGKFFLKKARIHRQMLKEFSFDVLMNLDDDALILNSRFLSIADHLFSSRKQAGILARYSLNHEFQPLAYENQLKEMYMQMSRNPLRGLGKIPVPLQPRLRSIMRPVFERAVANGYALGTSFIGGSWLITRECLTAITSSPEVDNDFVKHCPSADDDLYTIFCYACGFRVYDFLAEPHPFQIEWRKLSMSPQELLDQQVSVIHSVRDPRYGGEAQIREFFRQNRSSQ